MTQKLLLYKPKWKKALSGDEQEELARSKKKVKDVNHASF